MGLAWGVEDGLGGQWVDGGWWSCSPNSGYTEGVLTVSVKAGVRSGYALCAGGFVCAGMPF